MVDYNVVEELKDHDEIVIWGFCFNLFGEDGEGVVIEVLS